MRKSRRAIVIGGSLSGLLAARGLSDAYDQVLIFDRDQVPESIGPRRGVPQGRHVHGLLARGAAALDDLFGDVADRLLAAGALGPRRCRTPTSPRQ
ncbi:hypothetical protein [Dactylosporangium sp. NPDC049140]|uniref:hypothetical protein n=1 Tax=Dactylosporangium sp. NPDC049140 TaxID=3155647 RepID=UPI0033FCAC64